LQGLNIAVGVGCERDRPRRERGDDISASSRRHLFTRMFVGSGRVLVCLLAMFVSRFGVLFRLFMLAKIMMMGGLMMMMGGRVVMSGCLMMMLAGRMLWGLCHGVFLPTSL
jgi:hypothetical protein